MEDTRVDCGGLLWGERGTPAHQIHLVMRWNVWEHVGAKTIGDDCDLGGGGEWHAATIGT